jgi:hypothetical protein
MRQCQFSGCDRAASSSYARYCDHHRARLRRNGDPSQTSITKKDLKPYAELVVDRIAANAANPIWTKMDARWEALVSSAEARVGAYQAGTASPRQNIQAATEIGRVAANVEPRQVVVTVAAMYLMQSLDQSRFRSDRAFDTQLVRRVRGLTAANSTAYVDPKTGRTRRAYHELPPRAAAVMSDWLRQTLGVLGMRLAALEQAERRAAEQDHAELNDALMDLK